MKISIYVTASTLAIALMLTLAFGSQPVEAQEAGPMVYIDNLVYRTAPQTAPWVYPKVTAVGQTRFLYVKIARAPHESTEPGLPTDKTFSWGFTLTYDTSMFKVNSIAADITEEPVTVTTAAQFLKRRMYAFDPDGGITGTPEMWYLSGFYSTSFAKGEATLGTLTVGDTILAPSPTTVELPLEYSDAYYGSYAPDAGRHEGGFYDLPYTVNATQLTTQPDGSPLNDPSYCLLAIIKLTAIAIPPANYPGSALHLSDIILLQGDTTTNYFYTAGGTTRDAYYGQIPAPPIPEFPFGLGVIMMIAPAIALMYAWRTHKKQRRV